jgi:hypothetical protein
MDDYADIEIRIGAWDDDLGAHPVEAALGDGGSFTGGRFAPDRAALRAAWLDPVAYGRQLTDALIAGPIRQAYDLAAAQADAKSEGRLRVRLRIDPAAAELHALLWERLRHKHRGREVPLTTSTYTLFSRYVGLEAAEVAPLAERPVRLLIAIANPANLPPSLTAVDVAEEIEGLAAALGNLRQHQQLAVTILPGRSGLPTALRERLLRDGFRVADGPTSLDNLRRLLLEHHALHIVSHGSFQRGTAHGPGTAALHLEGDDGSWQVVTDDRLVPALAAAGVLPHLIFLVACDSATRDDDTVHPFVGLGPKLVEAGVPAVVAMQDKVTVRAARQLASDFWRDLLAHGEVDRALNAGRLLLVDDEGTDWSTPVLFMRLRDGRLFEPQRSPVAMAPPVAASLPLSQQRESRGQDEADAPEGRSLKSIWTNLPGIAKSIIGLLTVLIPLMTAWVQAGIPPFAPGPTPTAAASTLAATLMDVQLGARNVPLRQVYQDRPQLDPAKDGISPEELDQRGQLVSYRIEFQGLLDRRCEVKWTLYDAATGERVPDGTWKTNHAVAWPDGFWTVEARERDVGQGEVWVPHVAPGQFVVELEVYDDRGILLDAERPMDAGGQPETFKVG